MNKLISGLSALALGVGLLTAPALAQDKGTIGIAMPTKSSARWISDGNSMVEQFEAAGYTVDLQYAEDDIPNQLAQIENMITKGVDVLVIAAIDGTTLSNALENAHFADIKTIAYDRLIRDSEYVDYYATFDNFKVGVQQASSIVDGLKERFPDVSPWNVELFGGSPDDNNAYFFYNGAMSAQGCGIWVGRSGDAHRVRSGCGIAVDQVDHRGRTVFDRVQGHPRTGPRDGWYGRCAAARRRA